MSGKYIILLFNLILFITSASAFGYTIIAVEEGDVNVRTDNKPRWSNNSQNKQYFKIEEEKKAGNTNKSGVFGRYFFV